MNQMRHVLKRDNLYTLFALGLWLFILKYILKLRKQIFSGVPLGLANALPRGSAKSAKSPPFGTDKTAKCPVAARGDGAGRTQVELLLMQYKQTLDKIRAEDNNLKFIVLLTSSNQNRLKLN